MPSTSSPNPSSTSFLLQLLLACLIALAPLACSSDPASGEGAANGTGGTLNDPAVGTGGGTNTTTGSGGSTTDDGGAPLSDGPTTDALETVDAQYWVSYDGDSGALDWAIEDDGTGNLIIRATATEDHEESASVSLSIPQADLTDDMARSKGVRFSISGSGTVLFQAQSGAVIPESSGGWCDPEAGACWNAHEQSLSLTEEWQTFEILWADMVQPWGTDTNPVALFPSDILLISWIIPQNTASTFYLDAIELIPDDGSGSKSGLGSLLSKAEYNAIAGEAGAYSYENLLAAAEAFPAFGGDLDEVWAKREVAMFLANTKWETGSFQYTEEVSPGTYCDQSQSYGCPAGADAYYGRGAMQLSWNYNYKAAGDYLGLDLLNDPDLVTSDPVLLWTTALWFWMNPGNPGSPHAVYKSGFGETIRAINGAVECDGGRPDAVSGRVSHYQNALSVMGVDGGGTDTGC